VCSSDLPGVIGLVVFAVLLGVVGAGVRSAHATSAETRITCRLAPLKTAPKLPAGYPKPGEVVYTSAVQAGPSLIVKGYFKADLDEALDEYKAAVAKAHYKNLKTEHDPDDAEINYSGAGTTGQIALRNECKEAKTTFVQITSRPNVTIPSWFTELRTAVNDLVRETANADKAGSLEAFKDVDETFAEVKARLRVKAPDETEAMDMWIEKADASVHAGKLAAAHVYAVNMTKELADAAEKLTASSAPAATGLAGVFDQLDATAHDLDQEVGFHDAAGTKRELAAFTKLFVANRAKIEQKSPKAEQLIGLALKHTTAAVMAANPVTLRLSTKALIVAVAAAEKLAGV